MDQTTYRLNENRVLRFSSSSKDHQSYPDKRKSKERREGEELRMIARDEDQKPAPLINEAQTGSIRINTGVARSWPASLDGEYTSLRPPARGLSI